MMGADPFFMDRDCRSLSFPDPPFVTRSFAYPDPLFLTINDRDPAHH